MSDSERSGLKKMKFSFPGQTGTVKSPEQSRRSTVGDFLHKHTVGVRDLHLDGFKEYSLSQCHKIRQTFAPQGD